MNRIHELRRKAGLTQTQLADKIGLSQNTISQYESGRRPVSSRVVLELSQFFNVAPAYLLGDSDENNITTNHALPSVKLSDVRKIYIAEEADDVNLLLRMGWRLLHIGEEADHEPDIEYCRVKYTLGWFGNLPAPDIYGTLQDQKRNNLFPWPDDPLPDGFELPEDLK